MTQLNPLTFMENQMQDLESGTPWVSVFTPDPEMPERMIQRLVRYDDFVRTLMKKQSIPLMLAHCGLGITGEAGELADVIKREINYERTVTNEGVPIREGVKEELGDILWYVQATMMMYSLGWSDILQHNANKLGKRYVGLVYSDEAAEARADKSHESHKE